MTTENYNLLKRPGIQTEQPDKWAELKPAGDDQTYPPVKEPVPDLAGVNEYAQLKRHQSHEAHQMN